MQNNSNTKLER
eukprot:gene19914-25871_t